jgi:hypothetical protein
VQTALSGGKRKAWKIKEGKRVRNKVSTEELKNEEREQVNGKILHGAESFLRS